MPKWDISACKLGFYTFQVEAKTEKEAWEKARNHPVSELQLVESQDFEILTVTKEIK